MLMSGMLGKGFFLILLRKTCLVLEARINSHGIIYTNLKKVPNSSTEMPS